MLKKIIDKVNKNISPFDERIDNNSLFNIVTGRAASEETASFLLNVYKLGEEQKENFILACNNDRNRFEASIKKNVIRNFASECLRKMQKITDGSKKVLIWPAAGNCLRRKN